MNHTPACIARKRAECPDDACTHTHMCICASPLCGRRCAVAGRLRTWDVGDCHLPAGHAGPCEALSVVSDQLYAIYHGLTPRHCCPGGPDGGHTLGCHRPAGFTPVAPYGERPDALGGPSTHP